MQCSIFCHWKLFDGCVWWNLSRRNFKQHKCLTSIFQRYHKSFCRRPISITKFRNAQHTCALNNLVNWSNSRYSRSFCLWFFENNIHLNLIWYKLIKSSHLTCELQKTNKKRVAHNKTLNLWLIFFVPGFCLLWQAKGIWCIYLWIQENVNYIIINGFIRKHQSTNFNRLCFQLEALQYTTFLPLWRNINI